MLLSIIDPSEEGAAAREALSAALYQETEGNPFFIREVLAHLVETGKIVHENGRWIGKATSISELGIPEGVREVIGRRLSRLSDGCNHMLTLASTMTGGFSWEALKAINNVAQPPSAVDSPTEAQLLDLLEEALAAQLIAERKGEGSTYDYTHALIRQTLYGELSGPRRVLLHRQIGESLEGLYGANADAHLPELAHHFYQAAPGGDIEKAVEYATRAGDRAMGVTAWEEAAGQYERALLALELRTPPDEMAKCDVLLAIGDAHFGAGSPDSSSEAFRRAANLARRIDDGGVHFAKAALGYTKVLSVGMIREDYVAVLRDAIDRMPDEDSALRARLIARLGQEMYFGSQDEFRRLTTEALAMARRVGDKSALSETLTTRMFGGSTFLESDGDRLATANEILSLAEETGDRQRLAWGLFQRIAVRIVRGQMREADVDIAQYARVADELRMVFFSWQLELFRGMRALFTGAMDEAERFAQSALAIGQPAQPETAFQMFSAQLFAVRREQGRLDELTEGVRSFVDTYPALPSWRTALAYNYAERGMDAEARAEFETLARDDFAMFPRDANWPIALALLSETCAYLRDAERAAALYHELAPSGALCIIVGAAVDSYGATHRLLGRLAGVMRRWDEAERHFEDALEMNARMGSARWNGWTQFQYADMLIQRAAAGDRERAVTLLSKAIDTAGPLGMKALVERALALKMQAQGISSGSIYTSIDSVARAVETERPAITVHPAPDGTVTIMFSDIEDSTVLTERLGDLAWQQLLNKHNALIREQLQAYGGYEVKTMGDGFMVAFQSAKRGLDCAIAIQRAFDGHNAAAGEHVKVRIGLHAGEAIKDGDDFYGKNVIMASRVAGKAAGGEILVSSLLRQLVESSVDAGTFGDAREVELKGLAGAHTVFAVGWQSS